MFEGQLLVQWSTLLVFWQVRWLQEGQKGQRVFSAVHLRKDAQGGPADVTLDHACSREAFLWLNRRQSQNLWLPEILHKKIVKKHQKNRQIIVKKIVKKSSKNCQQNRQKKHQKNCQKFVKKIVQKLWHKTQIYFFGLG